MLGPLLIACAAALLVLQSEEGFAKDAYMKATPATAAPAPTQPAGAKKAKQPSTTTLCAPVGGGAPKPC